MADNKIPKRNLYKEAFISQYNLILLAFALVVGVISGSLLPIVAAVGMEILYLAFVPETQIFKRLVDKKYAEIDQEMLTSQYEERMSKLQWGQRERYESLAGLIENTKENLNRHGEGLGDSMVGKLRTLEERFLWMMETANSYDHYLKNVDHDKLKGDLHQVQSSIATAKGVVKRTLEERHNILSERLERLEKVYENRIVVNTQISTVEDMMRLIFESSLSMTDPRGISQQVDDLLIDVESTEETVSELDGVNYNDDTELEFDSELEKAIEAAEIQVEESF